MNSTADDTGGLEPVAGVAVATKLARRKRETTLRLVPEELGDGGTRWRL